MEPRKVAELARTRKPLFNRLIKAIFTSGRRHLKEIRPSLFDEKGLK